MIQEEMFEWKKKVAILDVMELRLEKAYREKKISRKNKEKIKKKINMAWIRIWDSHPNQHPLCKELFELNFG
jgi:hypothetical protein